MTNDKHWCSLMKMWEEATVIKLKQILASPCSNAQLKEVILIPIAQSVYRLILPVIHNYKSLCDILVKSMRIYRMLLNLHEVRIGGDGVGLVLLIQQLHLNKGLAFYAKGQTNILLVITLFLVKGIASKSKYKKCWKFLHAEISHFWVVLSLCFKARLSAKPFVWKWVPFTCK